MKKRYEFIAAIVAIALISAPALAVAKEEGPAEPEVKVFDFEGDDILGTRLGTFEDRIHFGPRSQWGNLIVVRMDFVDQMIASVESL